jgi:hypothetical protein
MQIEKKVKIIIITIALILSLTFITIVFILNKNDNEQSSIQEENNSFEIVTDYNIFFSVETNINKYINAIIEKNYNEIYEILDSSYIQENNISIDNLLKIIPNYEIDTKFKIYELKSYELNDNVITYYAKGDIVNDSYNYNTLSTNEQFIIFIDYNNQTISIYPINENDNYENIIKNVNSDYSISKNNYNSLKGIDLVNNNTICLMYLSDFILKVLENVEEAYELTTNYSTVESFEEFLNTHELSSVIASCEVNNTTSTRIYSVIDDNNNIYKFTEKSIMDYSIAISD